MMKERKVFSLAWVGGSEEAKKEACWLLRCFRGPLFSGFYFAQMLHGPELGVSWFLFGPRPCLYLGG